MPRRNRGFNKITLRAKKPGVFGLYTRNRVFQPLKTGTKFEAAKSRRRAELDIRAHKLLLGCGAATLIAAPAHADEGPVSELQRSAAMLKKTWGEQIIGNFSFGFIFLLLSLPGVLVLVLGVVASSATLVVVSVLYFIGIALAQSALQGIFQAALYLYMRDGEAPEGFEAGALQASIGHR